MSADPNVAALLAAFDAERTAILSGDFQSLAQLQERKMELGVALERNALSADDLQALSDKIARNAALLTSANAGVAQARETISTLRRGLRTSVYDKNGTVSHMEAQATKIERKA